MTPASETEAGSQLRKSMGFWDVLLFNIAAVLGPRWIAAAGRNGTSSISLWVLAALTGPPALRLWCDSLRLYLDALSCQWI